MTLEEFSALLAPDDGQKVKDVQLSNTSFARIYKDKTVYITDDNDEDFILNFDEIKALFEAIS